MNSKAKLLGIDVGTGGSRALLIGEDGALLASSVVEHQPFRSPQRGWAEQDPEDWWRASSTAIHNLLQASGIEAGEIAAIGLSGQMHGAVLLDSANQVLRPALIWCDQRTESECHQLTNLIGREKLVDWTSNPALTNFTLTKLLWVRAHEPETWKRFARFVLPKDYVRLQLTGVSATDVSDASGTLLLDVRGRKWSHRMFEAVGIDTGCAPLLFESPEISGYVTEAAARATGLKTGTPVVAGAGDQAAGAVGMGIVQPGDVSATIGTSGVVFAATEEPFTDPEGRLHTFCHAVPERWHVMGVTQAAGLSLRWFRDCFGVFQSEPGREPGPDPYDLLLKEAAATPPGADGVLWAPYLMGERTPHLDPNARAALIGLAAHHGRSQIIRAILEGVAFSLKDTFTIFSELSIPVHSIRLGGGGARSALWRQIQADVYGHTVEMVATEQGAAYGAAILAGVGAGVWPSVDRACEKVIQISGEIQPDASSAEVLRRSYARFRRLYSALRSIDRKASEEEGAAVPSQ